MAKDIEWLKKEIRKQKSVKYSGYIYTNEVIRLINQLDEPEVLSQEWVDENKKYNDVHDIGYYIPVEKLQNLLVPKQDGPVVPTWFDEWWKDVTKGGGSLFHNIERFYDELFSSGAIETFNYISDPDNKKKLLNIIVNELDYVVEKEQKYVVELPNPNNQMGRHKNVFLNKKDGKVFIDSASLFVDDITKYGQFALTEEEIKKDFEWAWKFAKPVEEVEG